MAMVLLIITSFLFCSSAFADNIIELNCVPKSRCKDTIERVKILKTTFYQTQQKLLEDIKKIGIDEHVFYMSIVTVDGGKVLVEVEKRPILKDVVFKADSRIDEDKALKISQLAIGESYYEEEREAIEARLHEWMVEEGYRDVKVQLLRKFSDEKVVIEIDLSYGGRLIVGQVNIDSDSDNILLRELLKNFRKKTGRNHNKVKFRQMVKNMSSELRSEGYLNNNISFSEKLYDREKKVDLSLNIKLGKRYQFFIHGNEKIGRQEIKEEIKKDFNNVSSLPALDIVKNRLENLYRKNGFYNNTFDVRTKNFKSFEGIDVISYVIQIKEGHRYNLKSVNFLGNSLVSIAGIRDYFNDKSSALVSRGFLDKDFFSNFKNQLKEFYLRKGFIFVKISDAEIVKDKKNAIVNFFIKERQKSVVRKIIINGVDEKIKKEILQKIVNKEGAPLNVLELENDITRSVTTLKDLGYYYARFKNKNQTGIVKYDMNFSQADIYLDFDPGKIVKVEELIYVGNIVTKKKVLEREVDLVVGDVVTPDRVKFIRDSLNALGIFSKVSVLIKITNLYEQDDAYKARLIIKLRERALGRVEIAPGFRTDLGAKFSFSFIKNNLWGLNHSFNAKILLNRRFSFRELDRNEKRRSDGEHMIEMVTKLTYSWPYLFKKFNFDSNVVFQRRRFFSFDADIIRISPQLSRQFNKYFATSLKYQFEQIRQYNASNVDNDATFRIGGITPSFTLDFRDNRISPRSGSHFGLSWEFANPYFGSRKDETIEINFSKLTSRNKFYLPLLDKNLVFALSLAAGYQNNYATDPVADEQGSSRSRGYIPSIKVFRLDGYDMVRGFADSEINRLDSGQDIWQTRVDGSAYFTNIKLEPRYYVNDNFVLGLFLDAGRVFVNNYRFADLRTAVGLSFKLLTPVGTLDFDYGVKTRRRDINGIKEDFGRFHLNIGTF